MSENSFSYMDFPDASRYISCKIEKKMILFIYNFNISLCSAKKKNLSSNFFAKSMPISHFQWKKREFYIAIFV